MGKPAARVGDMAGHGGTISFGEMTVLINGKPAARVGDPFICPGFDGPKPHVSGNIIMGSQTVIIGGAYAARMGDPTGCGVAGIVGKGMPATLGPSSPPKGPDTTYTGAVVGVIGDESGSLVGVEGNDKGKNSAGVLWGQAKPYTNDYGARGEVEGSLVHAGGETDTPIGQIGGAVDFGNVAGEAHAGLASAGASGEATLLRFRGKWETSEENPVFVGAEGDAKFLTAEAKADVLLGTDGRRTGIGVGLGAEAAEVKGTVSGKAGFRIPFTNYTFGVKITGGGSLGSVGAGGEAGIYHDREDDKYHAMIGGGLAALIGIKVSLDFMIGKVPKTPPLPPNGVGIPLIPGTIGSGEPTVLIG